MPTYLAKVRRSDGATEEQLLTVPSESKLPEFLARVDGFVIECRQHQSRTIGEPRTVVRPTHPAAGTQSSRTRDLVAFTWYLHTMMHAGVPLIRGLQVVQGQLGDPQWSRVLNGVIGTLEKGESFADSLQRFPRFFPKHYVHLIDVGEVSGNLDKVLEDLARYGEKQMETRSQIRGALAYPTVLVTACTAVTIFLISFVLPRIAKVFVQLKMELPWVTNALLTLGTTLRAYLPALAIGGAVAAVAGLCALRVRASRRVFDRFLLTCPVIGPLYTKLVLARFCQTLALLQSSGVSLLVSLELARTGLRNIPLEEFMQGVEANLKEGAPLGKELARSPHVPPMVSTMVSVGEESGSLGDMLGNVARFYDRDVERTIRVLPKILEPLIIVLMTVVVGLIAASIFIPLAEIPRGFGPR
ncbi:MAG: type II secretion system F family protein [Planctomycetes bacterium]|nr:type II secretion system F family protein [Planctomycetota bacterium]